MTDQELARKIRDGQMTGQAATDAVNKMGGIVPQDYQPVRGILTGLGYSNEDIGYNPQTKNVTIYGKDFDSSGFIGGTDQHLYANPSVVQQRLNASGVTTRVPQYTNPYATQLAGTVQGVQDYFAKPFQYNPSTDASLQQAQKQTETGVRNMAASRNMLYGDTTQAQVAQETAALIPQYEQIAYQKWADEGSRLMQFANFFQNLSDSDFNRFQQQWEMDNTAKTQARQERLDRIAEEQRRIENAYKKLGETDYVDNEIAIATGLKAGTQSGAARRLLDERKWQIETEKRNEEAQIRQLNRQAAKEKSIIDYQTKINQDKAIANGTAAPEQMGSPAQVDNYYRLLHTWFNQNSVNPLEAYNNLIANKGTYVSSLGANLYNKMLNDVSGLMENQKAYGDKGLTDQQTFTQQNNVVKQALSMKNEVVKGGYNMQTGQMEPDKPQYTNEQIAQMIANSGTPDVASALQSVFSIDELRAMGLWEDPATQALEAQKTARQNELNAQ